MSPKKGGYGDDKKDEKKGDKKFDPKKELKKTTNKLAKTFNDDDDDVFDPTAASSTDPLPSQDIDELTQLVAEMSIEEMDKNRDIYKAKATEMLLKMSLIDNQKAILAQIEKETKDKEKKLMKKDEKKEKLKQAREGFLTVNVMYGTTTFTFRLRGCDRLGTLRGKMAEALLKKKDFKFIWFRTRFGAMKAEKMEFSPWKTLLQMGIVDGDTLIAEDLINESATEEDLTMALGAAPDIDEVIGTDFEESEEESMEDEPEVS